jgi:hypothetical protein
MPEFNLLPSYSVYGANHNAQCFTDANGNTFWFSYTTLVAFKIANFPIVVHENDWGNTTGKHLNLIDGGNRATRLKDAAFRKKLKQCLIDQDESLEEMSFYP